MTKIRIFSGEVVDSANPADDGKLTMYLTDPRISLDTLDTIKRNINEDHVESVLDVADSNRGVQWCKFIQTLVDARTAIARESQGTGIHTVALIYLNGSFWKQTPDRKSGEAIRTTFRFHPTSSSYIAQQLKDSVKDAEVDTLYDVAVALESIRNDPQDRIFINIVGNFGPCDGCDSRIQNFVENYSTFGPLCNTLVVCATYSGAPHVKTRLGRTTHYGRPDQAVVIWGQGQKQVYREDYTL